MEFEYNIDPRHLEDFSKKSAEEVLQMISDTWVFITSTLSHSEKIEFLNRKREKKMKMNSNQQPK